MIWLTGLSSAGKSTIAKAVAKALLARGIKVEWLDGDVARERLGRGLGFGRADRDENNRRIGYVASLLARHGVTVVVSAISPYRMVRDELRTGLPGFFEVYVNAPLRVCEGRDVKGLYRRARGGEIRQFTGVGDPYEPPLAPEVECRTDQESVAESVQKVLAAVLLRIQYTCDDVGRYNRAASG